VGAGIRRGGEGLEGGLPGFGEARTLQDRVIDRGGLVRGSVEGGLPAEQARARAGGVANLVTGPDHAGAGPQGL